MGGFELASSPFAIFATFATFSMAPCALVTRPLNLDEALVLA
jgi:hypothetical protein